MEQLFLNLKQIRPLIPSLDNFLIGENSEMITAVRCLAEGKSIQPVVFIFGPSGSGRTHLLTAAANQPHHTYINAEKDPTLDTLPVEKETLFTMIAIDNVHQLAPEGQQRVFHLCNQAQIGRGSVLAAADMPPKLLHLREDLRMRFMQGLAYAITPLTDVQKFAALKAHVTARQMPMPDDALQYLLNHAGRDLSTLVRLLALIDHISLTKKQRPSLTLVRETLHALQREMTDIQTRYPT